MAALLGLNSPSELNEASLRQAIAKAEVDMYGGDLLLYFTNDSKVALLAEGNPDSIRQLTAADADLFKAFEDSAAPQDLDDAYVELDHWAVFGSFEGERLASVASAYPWRGSTLADIGVMTLPAYRGKGHGRAVVRALSRHAYGEGYEPQYRCQLDNHASIATAAGAGLTQFGTWEVVSS